MQPSQAAYLLSIPAIPSDNRTYLQIGIPRLGCETLAAMLQQQGHTVMRVALPESAALADTIGQALEQAAEIDAIVLDLGQLHENGDGTLDGTLDGTVAPSSDAPAIDVVELYRALQSMARLAEIPVVILGPDTQCSRPVPLGADTVARNNGPTEKMAADLLAAGAWDYIPRPCDPTMVAHKLNRIGRLQAKTRALEQRLILMEVGKQAVELAANPIAITDRNGAIEWVNQAFYTLTGFSLDEVYGKTLGELVKSGIHERSFYQELWETILGGSVWHGEIVNQRKDGSQYFEEMTITPIPGENGTIERFIAVKADVTERRQMLAALKEAGEKLERAVRAGNIGLWEWDAVNDRITYSHQWRRQLGYAEDELDDSKETWHRLIHEDDRGPAGAALQKYLANPVGSLEQEFRLRHKNGEYRWFFSHGELIYDDDKRPVRMVGSNIDITEQKRLQSQFLQAQRLESVGRLAGGVAHDFNNLLTVIGGYIDLALHRTENQSQLNDPVLRHQLDEVRKATDRATELTRRLLLISRREMVEFKPLQLNEVLDEARSMLRRVIGEDIELNMHTAPDLRWIEADSGQMHQVLMNLVVNARDAMPTGGKLDIYTENITLHDPLAAYHCELSPGDYVRLRVVDSGIGMAEDVLAHLFEPFFTTKSRNQGTGLGLATVHAIVEQTKGCIRVESEFDRGSSFEIYFPPAESRQAAPLAEDDTTSQPAAGSETILIVEDEGDLRRLVGDVLATIGYTTLIAEHSEAAQRVAVEHTRNGGAIDLLLTDVVMPGINGRELAHRLQQQFPQMRVLFMSGYTDDEMLRRGISESSVNFLPKPFGLAQLVGKVRLILDGDN